MDISIILCTHNRCDSLKVTLDSLARMTTREGLEWEVLVVDNNSTDRTREVVEAAAQVVPCRYLFERRQGKSFALNRGIPEAKGDVVAFTDDDVEVHPAWLPSLWAALESGLYDGVGGRILPVWEHGRPDWYVESGPYRLMKGVIVTYDHGDEPHEAEMLPFGANMAFRRSVFEEVGLFRTDLGPNGELLMRGEDTEFCQRVLNAGRRILYVPAAIVYHPVEEKRVRKEYFLEWYYQFGKRDVRIGSGQPDAIRWFGVPRHIFRSLATDAVLWWTSVTPQRRFHFKLKCHRFLGQIAEFRRIASEHAAGAPPVR